MGFRRVLLVCLILAGTARADTRVVSGLLLVEPGQAAPVLRLRNIAANGRTWEVGIEGWTVSAGVERPLERGRSWFATVSATPFNAHSSRRIYENGRRARALEFDSGSYTLRGGLRIPHGEHASTEVTALIGQEVIDHDAPAALRDAWDGPYGGLLCRHRYRRVTAEDPFSGSVDGWEVSALAELYAGSYTWSRLTLTQSAGRRVGPFHLRQSAALMGGADLDTVSAFLVGGSWDAQGPTAIYGRRYAEYRVRRGVVASAGGDYTFTPRWSAGARLSAFRAPSITTYGSALQTTVRLGDLRLTIGAGVPFGGEGENPKMVYATLAGAKVFK